MCSLSARKRMDSNDARRWTCMKERQNKLGEKSGKGSKER
jgi:hypothetical protein